MWGKVYKQERNGTGSNLCCHEKFGSGPKPVQGDHFWLPKIVSPEQKCVCYWSVLTKSGPVRYKCQAHNENVSKDGSGRHGLIQRQSRKPDGGGLPVHDPKVLHVSLWMHGSLLFFCHCFTLFCSCINVTLLIELSFSLCYTEH